MSGREWIYSGALVVFCAALGSIVLFGWTGWGAVVALLAVSVATVTQPDRHPLEERQDTARAQEPPPPPPVNRRRVDVRA
jgi:hypothetical protein